MALNLALYIASRSRTTEIQGEHQMHRAWLEGSWTPTRTADASLDCVCVFENTIVFILLALSTLHRVILYFFNFAVGSEWIFFRGEQQWIRVVPSGPKANGELHLYFQLRLNFSPMNCK